MKRKFLSILLTLAMVLTLLPVSAMAEGEEVAQIGETKYATLAEAVEAVPTDNTKTEIVLLEDYIGSGIKVVAGKNIVFNLNNKTYTVNTPTVGSSGTETNGFQLLKDSKVTFKNGTLNSATGEDSLPNGGILIQNYCDLTLENVTLDTSENSNISYVISNNFGSLTAKGNTVIKAANEKVAFDLWYGMNSNGLYDDGVSVTFGTDFTGSVTGNIEYGAHSRVTSQDWMNKAKLTIANGNFDTTFVDSNNNDGVAPEDFNITITGGTFTSDVSAYLSSGYIQNENGAVETLGESNAVAKVGDTYYKTLADAVTAADTTTVTLLKDTTENVTIPTDKTITLDLNGKTLSGGKNNNKAALLNNGTVTIKDSSATKTGTIKREDDADETGTSYYVIKNLGTMTIEQANVNNNSGYKKTNSAGYMAGSSLICNGDSDDNKETTLTINDGVFEQQNFLAVKNGAMGILNVNGGKFTSKHSAIQNWYKANIKGGMINGQLWTDAYTWDGGVSAGETKISGTTKFTGEIVMDITGSAKPTLEISGGEMNVTNWRITSAAANAGAKPVITGGLFSSEPAEEYIAENHYVDASNNGDYPYTVKEGTKTDAPVIVKDTTAVTVPDSEAIKGLTNDDKTNIANKSSVDGVAEAIADNKADLIPADVNTTDAKKVEIEVTVKVNVTSADMTSENKTLTFEASPVATVTVTKADGSTEVKNDVKVPNSLLNDEITVKLPLPAGFTPKQIKHTSSNGSVEYFINESEGGMRGAKQFTVDGNNCAVFTIYGFSTFELSGTVTYVEPSSGSGSSSSSRRYDVSAPSVKHGDVTVSPKTASKGDTVTVTVKPDSGYVLETLTVTDKNGNELTLKDKGNGKYTFTMPAGKAEVKATFMEDNSVLNFFYDVPNDAYFYEAVKWAVKNGITNGVGDNLFAPGQPCTRAQIVTFLWRAAGSPEPKGTVAGMTDVVSGSYYAKAVAWAIEKGITTGTAEGTFSPDATCTRAQAVTFLARAQNAKATGKTAFSDVPADSYFADAVAWAQANGVTTGTSETTFSPDSDCTRAQIVTFLYRANQGT